MIQRAYAEEEADEQVIRVPLTAGKHNLKIRAVSSSSDGYRTKGSFSAVSAIKIPKAEEDYPVITKATIDPSGKLVRVSWSCANPNISEYWLFVSDPEISSSFKRGISAYGLEPIPMNSMKIAATMPGDTYVCNRQVMYLDINGPWFIVIQGRTPEGDVFTSDAVCLDTIRREYNSRNNSYPEMLIQLAH